jgi:hypothetical protein
MAGVCSSSQVSGSVGGGGSWCVVSVARGEGLPAFISTLKPRVPTISILRYYLFSKALPQASSNARYFYYPNNHLHTN